MSDCLMVVISKAYHCMWKPSFLFNPYNLINWLINFKKSAYKRTSQNMFIVCIDFKSIYSYWGILFDMYYGYRNSADDNIVMKHDHIIIIIIIIIIKTSNSFCLHETILQYICIFWRILFIKKVRPKIYKVFSTYQFRTSSYFLWYIIGTLIFSFYLNFHKK